MSISKFFALPNGDVFNLDLIAGVIHGRAEPDYTHGPIAARVIIDLVPVRDDFHGTRAARTLIANCETDEAAIALRDEIKRAAQEREAQTTSVR